MEDHLIEEQIEGKRKKPKRLKNMLLGFLFWVVILGVPFYIFFMNHDYVYVLNTSDQEIQAVFTENTSHKEATVTVGPQSEGGKSFKNGVYTVDIRNADGSSLRTLKDVKVSDEDDFATFIDAIGDQSFVIVDISSFYEGNEAMGDDIYMEAFDGSDAIYMPSKSNVSYYNQYEKIPAEIGEDDIPYVLIPFKTDAFNEMSDDQIYTAMDDYIQNNLEQKEFLH